MLTYCINVLMGDSNKFQTVMMNVNDNDNKGYTTPNFCEMTRNGWTKFGGNGTKQRYCNGPNRFDKLRILIFKIISTKYFK
jgi:hypothetical protein